MQFVFERLEPIEEPNGFDIGSIVLQNHTDSHRWDRVILYIAIVDLLDGIRRTVNGVQRSYDFVAAGSSHQALFQLHADKFIVSSRKLWTMSAPRSVLLTRLAASAHQFWNNNALPEGDPVKDDFQVALAQFQRII